VGTKRQAQDAIAEEAQRCGMFFVNQRWLGGLLTNFSTIQRSLARLRDLEAMSTDGRYETFSKKEVARFEKERRKLAKNLDGIRGMNRLPDAVFVIDTRHEQIAVDEALFFSNSDRVQNDLLRDGGDRLVGTLKVAESSQQIATLLWQTVCSRTPTADETQAVVDWFSRSPERRVNDLQSLAWAVLAGTEFRFNH